MTAKTINMHGKIYNLYDETLRTKLQAQELASKIREKGKVAFLNPVLRKGQKTKHTIYVAEKSVRNMSLRKNISIKEILSEYSKGLESYGKWMDTLKESQKEVLEKVVLKKEVSEKEVLKKEIPKKAIPKKQNSKKKRTKKNSKK